MSGAREETLARIRRANGGAPAAARDVDYDAIPRAFERRGALSEAARLELFVERLRDYEATVIHAAEDEIAAQVAAAARARGKYSMLIAPDLPREWLPEGFDFRSDAQSYQEMDASEGVVTGCALAIAATGSIVLRHGAGGARRASSLIPDYHLCIVLANQVVETVPEGIAQMREFAREPITTIAGPSATADIEMIRVKGVHGPRVLDVILAAPPRLVK